MNREKPSHFIFATMVTTSEYNYRAARLAKEELTAEQKHPTWFA
jgi:hypothetical protein